VKRGRAVVVGAGPNGLSAALTLALEGWSVELVEGEETIGGGSRSAELTLPGFLHDVCSGVYPLSIGSPFLSRLPLEEHGLRWVHPPVPLAHPFDDGTAAVLAMGFEETGESLGSADGRSWRRLLEPFSRHWFALANDILGPFPILPRHPFLLARFGLTGLRSATSVVGRFRDFRARALFGGVAGHSFVPLDRIPTASFGMVLAASGHAVGWPQADGGAQRIPDALASMLRQAGGTIVTGQRVKSLDELSQAELYLLDMTPAQLLRLGGLRWPESYRRRLARYRYGPGVFKVDWALSGPIPWRTMPGTAANPRSPSCCSASRA
jgi:phytoene dehydrogenase-like protein